MILNGNIGLIRIFSNSALLNKNILQIPNMFINLIICDYFISLSRYHLLLKAEISNILVKVDDHSKLPSNFLTAAINIYINLEFGISISESLLLIFTLTSVYSEISSAIFTT